ncbi:MAG: hypothetical protein HZB47_15065 [Nitrosomonadales bacterium]|nr:hypothetical protein [Nitrosomonadales bacterium]
MKINKPSHLATCIIAMAISAVAANSHAAGDQGMFKWSASAGMGYDSNAYQAPGAPYVDYAALPIGLNPTITPSVESGYFVPYEIEVVAEQNRDRDIRFAGSATADGNLYLDSALANANEYNFRLRGGSEFVLARAGKSENVLYVGALLGKHKQLYVDHDSGLAKTDTVSGSDISERYSYIGTGIEAKYEHRTGKIDYGFNGQYILNNYEDPVVVSQLDHTYYTVGADASLALLAKTRLSLSFDHAVRDYSDRHSRDTQGRYSSANPLLLYTFNAVGATLHNRISSDWLLYLDFDHTQRTDDYVNYNDYKESRYGARVLFEKGRYKARLALHHWGRDYPNGFAFDVAGQGAKTFSGNKLKFKAEMEQSTNASLWTEIVYNVQNATDLRYDYDRTQIMAGMSWTY